MNLCATIFNIQKCAFLDIIMNYIQNSILFQILLLSGSLQDLAFFVHITKTDKEFDLLSDKLVKKIISIIFK